MNGHPAPVLAGFLTFLALLTAACGGDEDVELAGPDLEGLDADQVMVDVEHVITREGVRRAHLRADTGYIYDATSTVRFRGYTVDFFTRDGQHSSTLTAWEGQYDQQTGDMMAEDSVRVRSVDGATRLYTERLSYDVGRDRLESDVSFLFVRGRDTVRGTGFVTDPALDSLETRRPAVVSPPRIRDRDADPPGEGGPARDEDSSEGVRDGGAGRDGESLR